MNFRKPRDARGDAIDEAAIYVAVDALSAGVDGVPQTIKQGARLRGNHPLVRNFGNNWLPDGTPDDELHHRRWQAVYGSPAAAVPDTTAARILGPIPAGHRVIATKGLRLGTGEGEWHIGVGQLADDRDALLRPYLRSHFRREETTT